MNKTELVKEYDPFSKPISIYSIDDDDFVKKLKDICLKENKKHIDMTNHSWNENVLEWDYPEIKQLKELFMNAITEYLNKYSDIFFNFKLHGWCNVRRDKSMHPNHIHADTSLILNFYVSCPINSRIIYHNANSGMNMIEWSSSRFDHSVDVESGMLIITPPWIPHEVPPTYSDKERISISVNVIKVGK